MRICAFSDMHGNLDFTIEKCDLVLICGDIVPLKIQNNPIKSEAWFATQFIPWCMNLPCQKVLFVAGNHDFFLSQHGDRIRERLKDNPFVTYLACEAYEYEGVVIYGTPMCKPFGRWAFMPSYEEQDRKYDRHLEAIGHIDIIMSHDAPYGVSDILLQKDCLWADGSHIGNESLRRFVLKAKPKLMVKGHLHSCSREKEMLGETEVYTVSLLDEDYKMSYAPQYFDFTI